MTRRAARFVTVGTIGFLLQLSALALLTMAAGWPYVPATAIAVELAVLHNFWWHERWTWRDRTVVRAELPARIARYHMTTGITSIAGNLILTAATVAAFGLPPLVANVIAIASTSLANFLVADRWVFARRAALAAAAFSVLSSGHAAAAQLQPETVAAWNEYVAAAERRLHVAGACGHAEAAGESRGEASASVRAGGGAPAPVNICGHAGAQPQGEAISVPGGTIHHWRGSILIRGVTVDGLLDSLLHPGTPPPQEDVLESRVLARSGDSLRVYLKLVRRTIMTVTYDTEHDRTFLRQSPRLATSRSIATKIAEVGGRDRGFLWRLQSYWRYTQTGDQVRVDLESLSLSRAVPGMLQGVARPVIGSIARESLTRTLEALRRYAEKS